MAQINRVYVALSDNSRTQPLELLYLNAKYKCEKVLKEAFSPLAWALCLHTHTVWFSAIIYLDSNKEVFPSGQCI